MALTFPLRLASSLLACVVLTIFMGPALGSRHQFLEQSAPLRKPNATDEFLVGHNQARSLVHVGPLNWSQKLAAEVSRLVRYQRDNKSCNFADLSSSTFGANQAIGGLDMTPRQAIDLWASQKQFYNHANNTCAPGHDCNVYTQVVWKKTLEVGCAQARCVKKGATLTICFYFPPGNVIGEKPY
ncbi:STS14 protein [Magnolia sinica]|uniref:STS14 protein n=1 Tax=Magnolia sinica TaxID=86752 RepID=UPI00265A1391|nr:STS14 protein [Magnolia sinica]